MLLWYSEDGKNKTVQLANPRPACVGVPANPGLRKPCKLGYSRRILQDHEITLSIKYAFSQNFVHKPLPARFMRFYGESTQMAFHE
jgi:hypothetical protein